MKFYTGDKIDDWRIWGVRFGRKRRVTVAVTVSEWEGATVRMLRFAVSSPSRGRVARGEDQDQP